MSFASLPLTERALARTLVRKALARGYTVSVNDGEETVLMQSADERAIIAAMGSTDADTLIFALNGRRLGWVWLIYGNGEDLISDHTDREEVNSLVNEVTGPAAWVNC